MFELPELRDREEVFRDREHAGELVAALIARHERPSNAVVLALPAGGVPVAAPIAAALSADLDVAVVSKITLPWNTEVGYGAVAFDGSVLLNEPMLQELDLAPGEVDRGIGATRAKVERRLRTLRVGCAPLQLAGRVAVVVDDGVASGFTLHAVLAALRRREPSRLVVAVPTSPLDSAERLAREVDALYVANVRTTRSFAVAHAYQHWCDVDEQEALAILSSMRQTARRR